MRACVYTYIYINRIRNYRALSRPQCIETLDCILPPQLEAAGASLITVHGRHRGREDRRRDGSADLCAISAIVSAVSCPVLSNGNVRNIHDVHHNLNVTKAGGIMVAEELLRDFALFSRPDNTMNSLELADLYCQTCEAMEPDLTMDDGSAIGTNGAQLRGRSEFERYSVWWTNAETMKGHLKTILAQKGNLVSRNTFKNAVTVQEAIHCFRRRFSIQKLSNGTNAPPPTYKTMHVVSAMPLGSMDIYAGKSSFAVLVAERKSVLL